MGRPDVKTDARRVFDTLQAGGIAIIPADVGYAILASDAHALERVFQAKRRAANKRHAMIGNYAVHRDIHVMDVRSQEIIDHLILDLRLPLGIIGKYKPDHPTIKGLDEATLEASTNTENQSISIFTNGGAFQDELMTLAHEANMPVIGSSANLTGTGTKYRVSDINKEILDIVDVVIDYGLMKYNPHARSSTLIDFSGPTPEVTRIGACYEQIKGVLKKNWEIDLPEDPGMGANRFGHLKNLGDVESLKKLVTA
ncbi:DHBP synthase RibB-like alpha/beta domain-containing protein [Xylariaceae sp. AK1471]|nr:DHBP synthase RibB-like alpha/beta domain-containing protein [Xylariaceae sp. AK1471]